MSCFVHIYSVYCDKGGRGPENNHSEEAGIREFRKKIAQINYETSWR